MSRKIQAQLPLLQAPIEHPHADELSEMSKLLESTPDIFDLVAGDLLDEKVDPNKGRKGMTAEQVLRALLVKQMNGFSYEVLAFHLADSRSYQRFCRIGAMDRPPKKSTLQENIKRLTEETLEAVHRALLGTARREGIEKGRKVRVDCTVTETDIHEPSDSSLLWDSVRMLTRLLEQLKSSCGDAIDVVFSNHTRRAKRRNLAIHNAATNKIRLPLYKDLLEVTRKTIEYAERAIVSVGAAGKTLPKATREIEANLKHFIELALRVVDQTRRRVIEGERVPASDKIVSIFEEHTDIIIKSRRETEFGHKLCLTAGASSLVLDCVVEDGNPADATLATRMIERQKDIYGRLPRQAAFDGGFASKTNLKEIRELGVKDVAFHKKRGLHISDMAKSTWVYKQLRRFRAGVEGVISFLKRCFGLRRCTWKGLPSFKAYVWGSIITANLLTMARHRLT